MGILQAADHWKLLPKNFPINKATFYGQGEWPLREVTPDQLQILDRTVSDAYNSVMIGDFGTYVMSDIFDFSPTELSSEQPTAWNELLTCFLEATAVRKPEVATLVSQLKEAEIEEMEQAESRFRAKSGTVEFLLAAIDESTKVPEPSTECADYDKRLTRLLRRASMRCEHPLSPCLMKEKLKLGVGCPAQAVAARPQSSVGGWPSAG